MDFLLAAAACDYKLCWYKNTREIFRFMLIDFQKIKISKNLKFLKFENFRWERSSRRGQSLLHYINNRTS